MEVESVTDAFAALPAFAALDAEVREFLAGLVVDDADEADATFEESLGPFLEDAGAGDVEQLCAQLRAALAVSADSGSGGQGAAGREAPGARAAAAQTPLHAAPPTGGLQAVGAPPGAEAGHAETPGGGHSGGGGRGGPEGSSAEQQRRRRADAAWDAGQVRAAVAAALGGVPGVDGDMLDYAAGIVADDAGEAEAGFEDTIGTLLQGAAPGLGDADAAQLCERLREALDGVLAGPSQAQAESGGAAAAGASRPVRQLAGGPVCMGDLDEEYTEEVSGSRLKAHQEAVKKKEALRMQRKANQREKEAERKRVAAEASAARRAEEAAQRVEAHVAASYAVESTVSNRARLGAPNSVDIYIPEFGLPAHGGGSNLLEGAMLRLMHGHRYGLVGRNGTGKSTLLSMIASGRMPGVPERLRVLHVAQDSADRIVAGSRTEGASALQAVIDSDTRRSELLALAEELTAADELTQVYEALDAVDADSAPGRAAALLRGLQFSEDMMGKPVASLSGGWRMRVSIAAALFQEPDVLFLDEPTNHLDLEAVLWLGKHLEDWGEKTLVVVSHDRSFLNGVCTDIMHMENRSLTYYQGDYATFEAVREEKRERQRKIFEQQEAKRREMEKFVDKHLHKGQSLVKDDAMVKQAKKVAKQMDRIGTLGMDGKKYKLSYDGPQQSAELPEEEKGLSSFTFPGVERMHGGASSIQVRDVMFRYSAAEAPIFTGLNFNIDLTTRIGLLGKNGSGKSTLVKLITGQLRPSKGEVLRSHHLRVACFTQHHMDQLNLDQSPLEHLLEHGRIAEPTITPEEVRRRIGRFGMSGQWQTQRIRTLSGGQKSRVAFCKATWSSPHVLLLDEPTNHLDMDSIDSLIEAVRKFEGGIICVSHDQHFLTNITEELWVVGERGGSGVRRLDGSFLDYKKAMLKSLRSRSASEY